MRSAKKILIKKPVEQQQKMRIKFDRKNPRMMQFYRKKIKKNNQK
jgi:hypothetical protein